MYYRVCFSYFGCIIIWVAAWDFFTESRPSLTAEQFNGFAFKRVFPPSLYRSFFYVFVGSIMQIYCGTYYSLSFLGGSNRPEEWYYEVSEDTNWLWKHIHTPVKFTLAFIGMFLNVVGMYDIFSIHFMFKSKNAEYWCCKYLARDISYVVVGFALLIGTNGIHQVTMIFPPWMDPDGEDYVYPNDPIERHMEHAYRSFVVNLGYTLVTVAVWNFMENYKPYPPKCWQREWIYIVTGFGVLMISDSFVANSWLNDEDGDFFAEPRDPPDYTTAEYLYWWSRSMASLFGYLVNQFGVWSYINRYILKYWVWRNSIYLIISLIMLWLADGFRANMCFPDYSMDGDDEDEGLLNDPGKNNDPYSLDPFKQDLSRTIPGQDVVVDKVSMRKLSKDTGRTKAWKNLSNDSNNARSATQAETTETTTTWTTTTSVQHQERHSKNMLNEIDEGYPQVQ